MVVACCRFLCYFCRTGRINQRAMFEHLSYLLDNSCMLLCKQKKNPTIPHFELSQVCLQNHCDNILVRFDAVAY